MLKSVPLSKLVAGRRNPRRVRPALEAHRRLVASIRSFGLLAPLVVRPVEGDGQFQVIAGNRRLAALKEVHRGSKDDPKVPCEVRKAADEEAEALSLAENFAREAMHPLDEAEAFCRLAGEEGKDAEAIAAQFSVTARYVRQRMKLATLATPIKLAYREGKIDTGTAEAFATVPPERQIELWAIVHGAPLHADHVRNLIRNAWIDASHALFDVSTLPSSAVSTDLFAERVLVERGAFMEAQAKALEAERAALVEDGWAGAVVAADRQDVQDRLYAMDVALPRYDRDTERKLAKLDARRAKLRAKAEEVGEDDGDGAALEAIEQELEAVDDEAMEVEGKAPPVFAEATKALGTAFLILDPDGRVHREYRVPRQRREPHANGGNGDGAGATAGPAPETPRPPTSDDLGDRQLAEAFTQQALAVRAALLASAPARKRVLAMILHEKVRSEALAVRHEPSAVTLHATKSEGFASPALEKLSKLRSDLDPLKDAPFVEDADAYARLAGLSEKKLDALIDLLAAECLTAHMLRPTKLVGLLATELKVELLQCWKPDAAWLAGYQKGQLAHLLGRLIGPTYSPAHETRKKSDLVAAAARLFADAADGKLEDKRLAGRVNTWLPTSLRDEPSAGDGT